MFPPTARKKCITMDKKYYFIFVSSKRHFETEEEVQCCICDQTAYTTDTGLPPGEVTDEQLRKITGLKAMLPKIEFPENAVKKYICDKCAEQIAVHFAEGVARVLDFKEKQKNEQ